MAKKKTQLQIVLEKNALQQRESLEKTGLTVNEHINNFLREKIQERTDRGLKITTLCSDGELFTCYPKDQATKERWLNGFARKGTVIVES